MKKLFLVDAYALIFKYYYAFLGRPMRNRAGMNTSVVFGFVKFLRDIQKRERPDLLGVAFDPKGGSFRREIFPEYKANRAETPEDILLSVPYVKRVLEAMCIPILEVEGYEADDVIGTLSQKGVEAGYEVFMVTPDKDYGQLVRDNCKIYKQKGAEGSIEIVDREAIRGKYGIDDPSLVRDILALWGDASDNIPGVPGIGEKSACKLVQEWGTVENILDNVSKIKGKQGEKIAEWGDKLRLAKTLTTICLDVPIPFREEDLTVCEPHIDELKALFAELDFKAFMNDLTNLAPPEEQPEGPRQEAQTQLAEMARAKSAAAKRAALVGQGNLFGDPVVDMPAAEVPVAELQAEADAMQFKTAQTTPHDYRLVENASQLREVVAEVGKYDEFCFDTETTGFDIFNDRIVGMSLAVKPFEAWYIPFKEENTAEYTQIVRPLFEDEGIAKIGQNIKFDLMVLRRLGLDIRGRKYDTMILHYLLDPESRHNMNALSEKYLNYKPIEIETLIGKGSKQLTMDLVNVERVKEYAAEDADVTLQLKHVLYPQVEKIGLQHLYFEVEEPMIACFLLAGLPSASLILLAAALPLSLVILPCALTWYSGRFCWAAPIFLTLGFILIPSYFLRGYFLEIGLAGLASGLFAAAVQGFHLAARREMPCTAWAAYGGLTVLYLFVSLLDLLHDGLFTGSPMAGIWIAATVCCLGITLLVFRAGRRVTFYPAAWMVVLFALQFGMTYWTLPFDLGRAALHFAVVLVPQLLLTLVLLLRRPRAVQASE